MQVKQQCINHNHTYFLTDFPCSCFLLAMKDDSIEGIYDTLKSCALISKSAGGIGVAVSCIRATGSYIAGVSPQRQTIRRV